MGYTEGYKDGIGAAGDIVYTYHTHGDGYCTEVPVYHTHTSKTGSCYTPTTCGTSVQNDVDDGEVDEDQWVCRKGHYFSYNPGSYCPTVTGYNLTCKKGGTITGYKCDISEGAILFATIAFN